MKLIRNWLWVSWLSLTVCGSMLSFAVAEVPVWGLYEIEFESSREYENALYDLESFEVSFESPSGKSRAVDGFWDGGRTWRARFAPDEIGTWTYESKSSDEENRGLHGVRGSFQVVANDSADEIYRRGSIQRPEGRYHLTYADGTPFFWAADTAWNGALKSTEEEWDLYLDDRKAKGFNVIQLVTTQWRGAAGDRLGRVAFEGSGRISINPAFYQRLDRKMDRVNEKGLIAAPVLLWTLQFGAGRHLSPGYHLPYPEAIRLARYMVARYGGHQVIWILGGDGRYVDEYEQRWKVIGRGVFGDDPPGIVAQHPHGRSWIGDAYVEEEWLDIVGYQSSHSKAEGTVTWITEGPPAERWSRIPPKPIMNMEPIYEQILEDMTERDVRQASYWSLFATPVSGLSYGANGVWPWLREGEQILNHRDAPWTDTWRDSLDLPGVQQVSYLFDFIQSFEWWQLKPAHDELLVEQPGDLHFRDFVSVLRSEDFETILAYLPSTLTIRLRNPRGFQYQGRWFDPVANDYRPVQVESEGPVLEISSSADQDQILVLKRNMQ